EQAPAVVDVEAQVPQYVDVMLAQAEEVQPGLRRLRDDAERVDPEVLHLAEVEDDVVAELVQGAAQLERLRKIERAAQPDESGAPELLPHHLQASHPRNLTTRACADKPRNGAANAARRQTAVPNSRAARRGRRRRTRRSPGARERGARVSADQRQTVRAPASPD